MRISDWSSDVCSSDLIEAFGASPELHPLELFDDRLEPLDLAVTVLDDGRHVAHQLVQKCRIGRQIVEIEQHARYSQNGPFNPSISARSISISGTFSTFFFRSHPPLGLPPSDPFPIRQP